MIDFVKHDGGKLRWELVPIRPMQEIVKVLGLGAKKYSDDNWMKGCDWTRYYAAALRHLTAWKCGEDKDPETGLSHLAHAGCCVLFLLYFVLTGTGDDNRQKELTGDCFVPESEALRRMIAERKKKSETYYRDNGDGSYTQIPNPTAPNSVNCACVESWCAACGPVGKEAKGE